MSLIEPDITSPIVDTTGTLAEYRDATRGKWHKNLRRLYRKLLREHDAQLRLIAPPDDLESELAEGFAVESSGSKGTAGSAILSRPENEAYYRSLARGFHDRGELRLSSISVDGRMIAWDLGILRRNRLYSPKSGYLEDFRQFAPGLVLELSMIERCSTSGSTHTSCWAPTTNTSCASRPASAATGISARIHAGPRRESGMRGGGTPLPVCKLSSAAETRPARSAAAPAPPL